MTYPHPTLRNTGLRFTIRIFLPAFFLFLVFSTAVAFSQTKKMAKPGREYIEIRVYHAADAGQLSLIDQYLQQSLLPALETKGFKRYGVYSAIENDTAKDKRMVVIIPFASLSQLESLTTAAGQSILDSTKAPAYTKAAYNQAPFTRFETILLQAFAGAPQVKASGAQGNKNEQVFELRSYESPTEAFHQNKVKMFNSGEVELFQRLGFNAVFYGQVIAGSRMPNLMYMTSFENKAARDEHWKAFGSDPVWKAMSSDPLYKNNVSHIDISFLRPAAYSKL